MLCALPASVVRADDPPKGPSEETPYVQTPQSVVDGMLEMAKVTAKDFLIDLGSGDGRIVITAARRHGTRGYGVDYDPRLVKLATENARAAGVADRAKFFERDVFKSDVGEATVLTMYLLPEYNQILRPRLYAQLRPGARIVSHDYDMGEWRPDAVVKVDAPNKPVGVEKSSKVLLWIVPARVAGRWRFTLPHASGRQQVALDLTQRYQDIAGSARIGTQDAALEQAALRGTRITFDLRDGADLLHFEGEIAGERISGRYSGPEGKVTVWRASRAKWNVKGNAKGT